MKLTKDDKKIFYALFFPTLFETIILRLFHIADSIMLGQMTNSTSAVAAVGLCVAPVNLIICTSTAFFIGTTATIAWLHGANEKKSMRSVAWQSMIIASGIAVVLALAALLFSRQIMSFVCKDEQVLEIATSYFRINAYGFLFQIITTNITAILRGIGVSKLPMFYNIAGGVVNVVLNYLLIYGRFGFPELRADGAAIATSISKFVSLLIAISVLLFKNTDVKFNKDINFKLENSIKTRLIPIGITSALEQLVLQAGAVITTKIVAGLPVHKIAANQVVSTLDSFAWSTSSATQAAVTTLFGRSLGEHKCRKAKRYLGLAVKCTLVCAALEMAAYILLGKQLAAAFTNDVTLYPIICILLVLSAVSLPFISVHQTVSGALRSAGDSVAPLIASFISLWVFRVLLGYFVISVWNMDIYGYRACLILDQFVRCFVVTVFYFTGHWKKYVLKKRKV